MKKILVLIVAVLYITVSSGLPVTLHFCMDKLVGWGITHQQADKCGKCGMTKGGHQRCCHDEQKFIKLDNAHQSSEAFFSFLHISAVSPKENISTISFLNRPTNINNNPSHAPPRGQVATYIFICVFLI
jgi:hypothetical protein